MCPRLGAIGRAIVGFAGIPLAFSAALVFCPAPVAAQSTAQSLEAKVLLRALSYDRNLKGRGGSAIVAAVVFNASSPSSKQASEAMYGAFAQLEKVKVQGLKFRTIHVPYEDAASLKALIASEGVDLVYVCPGLTDQVSKISSVSRSMDVLTAGSDRSSVTGGYALGVFERSNKRVILVNLMAAKEEGASFSAQFLSLAEVIR